MRHKVVLASVAASLASTPALANAHTPHLPPETPLPEITFVAFDTETTGLDPRHDRIVEIGAVKFRAGEVLARKQWLINPRRPIPFWAVQVHGISSTTVRDAPGIEAVYPEFLDFCRGAVLLAQNARFDIGMLAAEAQRMQMPLPGLPVVDTLRLFRTWFPEARSHALEPLAAQLAIESRRFHRGLDDSYSLVELFWIGIDRLDPSSRTWGRLLEDAGGVLTW